MKRDIDLIKEILIQIEKSNQVKGWINIQIPGRSSKEVYYHIKLLHEAGLIEAVNQSTKSGFMWVAKSLTWNGHEFLDAARNDTVWENLKNKVKEHGGNVPFYVVKDLLVQISKDLIK